MSTIRKRSGKFQVRVKRAGFPAQSKTFEVRADAERWARGIERKFDLGEFAPAISHDISVGTVLMRYRLEVSPTKRGGDMEAIRLAAMERREIAHTIVTRLTAKDIAKYRDQRLQKVAGITVNRDLDDLSAVLNHARREWGIPVPNPVADVRRPLRGKSRSRVLSCDEELRLLDALATPARNGAGQFIAATRNSWVKPLVQLAIYTAMRRGELLSLRWCDINHENRTAVLHMTKNGDSRTVPLSSSALVVLSGLPQGRSQDLIFPITGMALGKAFERACERARLTDLHFHDLRHTATTRLSKLLPNVIELAAVTGHRDLRMLQRYYHPRAEDLAKKIG